MVDTIIDRAVDTTTTTGTGDITCAGAVLGYQSFNAVLSSTNIFYYLIEAVDANGVASGDWETGAGTVVSTSPLVFSRAPITSSNAGALVSLAAGLKRVHITAPACQVGINGAVVNNTSSLTAINAVAAPVAVTWNNKVLDFSPINPFHSISVNTSRLTIPADCGDVVVKLSAQLNINNILANETVNIKIRDGGSTDIARATFQTASTNPCYSVASAFMFAGVSDYFEVYIQTSSDTSIDVLSAMSYFQIEVLQ